MNSGDTESSGNSASVVRTQEVIALFFFGSGNKIGANREMQFGGGGGREADDAVLLNSGI